MAGLKNLSYAVLSVSDFSAWRAFARDVVGMQVAEQDSKTLALRMDEHAYRLLLEKGHDDDIVGAGWEIGSDEALEQYAMRLKAAGALVRRADENLAASRGVAALYFCDDPNGLRHEFFGSRKPLEPDQAFKSDILRGPGFKTGPLGLGHILPVARNYQESIAFYRDALGMRYSDRIIQEIAPGVHADATFFHTQTGRHHSLATGQFPSPKRLNHLMLEYQDMNDVGAAYDRAVAAGVPIILELGHHPNDGMFSFYMRAPSGFGFELGWGGIVIDDAKWTPVTYNRMSDWGHKRREATIAEFNTQGN